MTVPAPPLPDFRTLFAACVPARFDESFWTGGDRDRHASTFRFGRYALSAAVEALVDRAGGAPFTLFVPDYICNEALEKIRTLKVRILFYPVDDNLVPRWDELETMTAGLKGKAALILVHYFGFPNDSNRAAALCERRGMSLIDDAAHMLQRPAAFAKGDAVVFSPHKLLPVGNCAVIVSREPLPKRSRSFIRLDTLRWIVTRVLQKFMIATGISWHRRWKNLVLQAPPRPAGESQNPDRYGESLLNVAIKDVERIAEQRKANYSRLLKGLQDLPAIRPLFSTPAGCPYVLPLRVAHGGAHALSAALLQLGVPAFPWPDLPPEVKQASSGHETAKSLFASIVLLPVHQSLRTDHIDTLIRCVRESAARLRSV